MEKLKVLFTEEAIKAQVASLAEKISQDYADKDLVLIGVLKSAFIFVSDLLRELSIPAAIDFIQPPVFRILDKSSLRQKLDKDIDINLKGKHVLIVDDIAASGYTIKFLVKRLKQRKAASIATCCLLDNPSRRKVKVAVKYRGFKLKYKASKLKNTFLDWRKSRYFPIKNQPFFSSNPRQPYQEN